jgi:catechol 2,3-dioxygenase-like lactoylglutathione lyase family enzyme
MPIVGIDEVQFVVNDGPAAEDFLLRWGLAPVGDAAGKRYECVDGSAVSFSVEADFDPAGSAFQNLAAVIWGVDEQGALEALERDLARDRDIVRAADGTVFLTDALGLKIGLRLSRKRPIAATPALFNTPGAPVRIDQPAVFYDRALPQEISHIVLGVVDHVAGEAFYRERLGFHVTDRYVGRGAFMRGPAVGTHHNLFMLADGKTVFNHLALKVRDIHEVIGGGQGFARTGAETLTGPGRHFASSGCFWYFKSPFGGAMEYVADEDIVTPAWETKDMVPSPEKFSEWAFHNGQEMGALRKA